MLRQFHYIDNNGKDQGVNVRNRAQELAKLLSDIDAIRAERKKARANRNKYGGVEGGMGMGGGMSSGSRYGGFGSEDAGYGGYRGEVYGDGGGFGGNTSGFSDTQRRSDKFEEYDEDQEDGGKSATASRPRASSGLRAASLNTIKRDAKIQKEPEPDLFDFGDEPLTTASNGKTAVASPKAIDDFGAMESGTAGDDDFDDFQSATTPGLATETSPPQTTSTITSFTSFVAPQPIAPAPKSNINDLFASISPTASSGKATATATPSLSMASSIGSPLTLQPSKPSTTGYTSTGPNYYTSVQSTINNTPSTGASSQKQPSVSLPVSSSTTAATLGKPNSKPSSAGSGSGADAFTSLWSTASGKAGIQNPSSSSSKGPDLASLARERNEAALWGTSSTTSSVNMGGRASGSGSGVGSVPPRPNAPTPRTAGQQQQQPQLGGGLDDLLG